MCQWLCCGQNYLPSSWILPVQGHNRQFQVMRAQAQLSEPKRKRAWQAIVRAKIYNQAEVLVYAKKSSMRLKQLARSVGSGDPNNCEAQAARFYWQELFGSDFRRDRDASGMNSALNYAYIVVRASVARGIIGAGLHPSFSLHHKNPQNPFNLVDDLMEPFRPIVDYVLWCKYKNGIGELDREIKSTLAALITLPLVMGEEKSPLSIAAVKTARSFSAWCLGEVDKLVLPTALPALQDVTNI